MSSKIQELAEQAKNSIPKNSLGVADWIETYNLKFAELVIEETMKQFNAIGYINVEPWMCQQVKNKFGFDQ